MKEYIEYWFIEPKYTGDWPEDPMAVLDRECKVLNAAGELVAHYEYLSDAIEAVEAHNARVRNKHGVQDRIANYRVADRLRKQESAA